MPWMLDYCRHYRLSCVTGLTWSAWHMLPHVCSRTPRRAPCEGPPGCCLRINLTQVPTITQLSFTEVCAKHVMFDVKVFSSLTLRKRHAHLQHGHQVVHVAFNALCDSWILSRGQRVCRLVIYNNLNAFIYSLINVYKLFRNRSP